MSDIRKCAEKYRDPAVEKRLMDLDDKTAAVHPGEFVACDGLYIHHRRDGAQVTVTVMSGEELAALRTSFDEVLLSIAGVPQASGIDCLEVALSVPNPDLDAVETVLRDHALAASADTYRTLLEAKDDALDRPRCPTCGGVMKRHERKRPKTFTTRLGY